MSHLTPNARHAKWVLFPALVAALLALSADEGQSQAPPVTSVVISGPVVAAPAPPVMAPGVGAPGGMPGGGFGGGKGGFGGGKGGPPRDPDAMWNAISQGKDSININDPSTSWMKRTMERNGDPIPANGIITKEQFKASMERRAASGGRSPGGPPPSTPEAPTMIFQQQPIAPGYVPGMPPTPINTIPQGRTKTEDDENTRVSVSRFGKLPKGVPSWFVDYDTDQDGMIGLYEWRRAKKPTSEFVEMDLNGDGYLTADEWVHFSNSSLDKKTVVTLADGPPTRMTISAPSSPTPGRGYGIPAGMTPGAGGPPGGKDWGTRGTKGGGKDRGEKSEKGGKEKGVKPANPFTDS